MNYVRIYRDFIADRRVKELAGLNGPTEVHHVLPRSLGGANGAANLVRLTVEDHVRAHLLLARIHGGDQWISVILAVHCGPGRGGNVITRRMRQAACQARVKARERHSELTKAQWAEPDSAIRRSVGSAEYRQKMAASNREIHSRPEVKAKHAASIAAAMPVISKKLREHYANHPEARQAVSDRIRGRKFSPEEKASRRAAQPEWDSAMRSAMSERMKEVCMRPEIKEARSRAANLRWERFRASGR